MRTVLIVDDEKEFLQSLIAGLGEYRNRIQMVTAHNGLEALDILRSERVDLVITDLRMPEMDGFELLTRLGLEFPQVPAIVMSAFATSETESTLDAMGGIRLIEKPVDLEDLSGAIFEMLDRELRGGSVTGISLANFLQLVEMEGKDCVLEIKAADGQKGHFYFKAGRLLDAEFGGLTGEEAAILMLTQNGVAITLKNPPRKSVEQRISASLMSLLMESSKRLDHAADEPDDVNPAENDDHASVNLGEIKQAHIPPTEDVSDEPENHQIEEKIMAKLSEVLEGFREVEGFMAIGVFSPEGEMAGSVTNGSVKLDELGAIANDVLLKAQKATEIMGVGRGNMLHIQTPKAQVVARCLNEATDFASTQSGRAHIHMVMVLSAEGNIAMAKMKLNAVIQEIAPAFR